MPTLWRDAPAASSLASSRGSTVSDDDVPTMISSSSRIIRMKRKMLNPLIRATSPRMPNTNSAHVPQNVTISRPRLLSDAEPNTATVYAMPPNAPSGATHMTSRMTPKMIRLSTSNTPTTFLRSSSARNEIAAAVRMPSTRMRRISFSTNGCTNEPGSTLSVMNGTRPCSPASPISSSAVGARGVVRRALEPAARGDEVADDQAERERDDRHREEVDERLRGEPAGLGQAADRGDADHDGDEDHRAGDGLDDLDEGVGEPLRLLRRLRRDEPERDARARSRSAPRTTAACRACGADDPPRPQRPATT